MLLCKLMKKAVKYKKFGCDPTKIKNALDNRTPILYNNKMYRNV